ncbi:MAG TPA: VOC family protein [Thermoanaerobaculia bacterium]|nr:VOC family protein [Thermoanaerobaculia bacterium]
MTKTTSHQPGSFCWIELMTSDAAGARAFYTQLFGWSVNEIPMGDLGMYSIFQKDGADAGAMYQRTPEMAEVPPFWMSYVRVDDADAATEQAKSLGATVHNGPFDVGPQGRMTVFADPQGAAFAVWQPYESPGLGVRDEVGTLCWNELQARDVDAAKKFYPALFPWRMKESPEYTEWHIGEQAIGGMMPSQAPAEVPSYWLPYFSVADCDATVAQTQSLGGRVLVPAFEAANVGRMSVLADPQGATFAVIKLMM